MDISARAVSLADRPRVGHSGHQCSHALGRPILHLISILSQTSTGNRLWGYVLADSLSVQFLCSCHKTVPSSRSVIILVRRAQGASRMAVALGSPLAPVLPGHAHPGPSVAPTPELIP